MNTLKSSLVTAAGFLIFTFSGSYPSYGQETFPPAAPTVNLADVNLANQAAVPLLVSGEASASVSYSITDGTNVVSGSGTLSGAGTFSTTVNLTGLSDGTVNASGSDTSAKDTVAPNTTITSNPANASNDNTGDFAFTSTEGGSTFQCSFDGTGFGACTSPFATAVLADGAHTFQVRATDPAGNTDATPASFTWTVDTVAPVAPTVKLADINLANRAAVPLTISGEVEPR